jgi:hypothetical protein
MHNRTVPGNVVMRSWMGSMSAFDSPVVISEFDPALKRNHAGRAVSTETNAK